MNIFKASILSIILLSVCIVAFILIFLSYETILVTKSAKQFKLNKVKYNKSLILKIYSDKNVLIYKNRFRWAGIVKNEDFSDNLLTASILLSHNRGLSDKPIVKFFTKFYHLDEKYLNNKVFNIYSMSVLKIGKDYKNYEKNLIKFFTIRNMLNTYTPKKLYLNYLNSYIFENNVHGIEGASQFCFGKPFNKISLKKQLYLISIAINNLNINEILSSKKKREIDNIIWHLYKSGKISHNELEENLKGEMVFKKFKPTIKDYQISEAILSELRKRNFDYKNNSYTVFSSINLKLQEEIRNLLKKDLKKKNRKLQSAVVVINYKEGKVKAIVGSINKNDKKDRAVNIKRQVGSIFKPIVYLTAFSKGYKPTDSIEDKPYVFKRKGMVYKPKNYDDFFMGKTKIQNGLIYSLNNLTVKLATMVGLNNVAKLAVQMGFEGAKPYMAMPLGSIPFTPYQVASSYTVVANYGVKKDISMIKSVINPFNAEDLLELKKTKRIISVKATKQVYSLMQRVVRYGTARGKNLLKWTAGKTGTTNNYKDAWFLAIYRPYVTVCWIGYDDYKSMGEKGTGGQTAAPIVAKIQRILKRY